MADQVNVLSIRATLASDDYVRGAQQIQAANKEMSQSASEAGSNVIQFESKVSSAADGFTKLVNKLDPAAKAARQFQQDMLTLNRAIESGKTSGDAAVSLYVSLSSKLGLVASESQIASQNLTGLAEVVAVGNERMRQQAATIDALAASYREMAAAAREAQAQENAQTAFNRSFGVAQPTSNSASASASVFEEQLRQQEEAQRQAQQVAQLRAQQAGSNFAADLNARLGVNGSGSSARDSAAVFEEEARAAEALQAKLSTLRAAIDPIGTSWAAMNKQIAEYEALMKSGAISVDEFAAAEDLARNRHEQLKASLGSGPGAANDNGNATFRRTNLGYQAFDVGQGLISGLNPAIIAAQQGPQIAQAYIGQGGGLAAVKSDLAALGGVLASAAAAIGPIGLAFAGATVAATAFYFATRKETKTTDDVLKEHAANIAALGEAYGIAEDKALKYSTSFRAVSAAVAAVSAADVQTKLASELKSAQGQFGAFIQPGRAAGTQVDPNAFLPNAKDIAPFADLFTQLRNNHDLEQFASGVKLLGDLDPALKPAADRILVAYKNAVLLNDELEKTANIGNKIKGPGFLPSTPENDVSDAGLIAGQQVQLQRAQQQFQAQIAAMVARSPVQKADAARQQAAAQYNNDETPEIRAQRIELAGTQALIAAEHELRQAKEDRVRASQASLAQAQYEASLTGQSVEQQNRLKAAYQAEAQIREAAARAGVAADQTEIANARAKAAAVSDLNAKIQAGKLLQDQQDQTEQLQLQARLIGASADEAARETAALQTQQQLRQQGINLGSQEAQQLVARAEANASLNVALQRQVAAYQSLQQAGGSMVDTLVNGITGVGGTWKDTLKNMATQFIQWIDQLAITNPIKNELFPGSNLPTLADLFSGKSTAGATPGVTSTAAMTVNAATVMINGAPLGGLPGLPGAIPGQTQGGLAGLIGYNPNGAVNGVRPDLTSGGLVNSPVPLAANQNAPATDISAYIQQAAIQRGIDPNVALRVAQSEGGTSIWNQQSLYHNASGYQEPSYGPFQLLKGGPGTGYPTGLGNQFTAQTGLDPSLAQNGPQGVNFALDYAQQHGWSSWYGAQKAGISPWQGIDRNATPIAPQQSQVLTGSISKLADTTNTAATNLTTLGDSSKTLQTTFSDFLKQPATPQNAPFPAAPQGPNYFPPAPTAGGFSLSGALGGIPLIGPLFTGLFHLFGFADGTDNAPGGLSLVGERGPELVNLPRGSQVLTNPQTRQMLAGGGGGGHTKVSVGVTVDNDGNLKAYVKSVAHSTASAVSADHVAAGIDAYRREGLYGDIDHYQKDPYARGAA